MHVNKSYLTDVNPQDSSDIPKFKILENTLIISVVILFCSKSIHQYYIIVFMA